MDLIERAQMFATAAHNGASHYRKVSGVKYITHPKRVADKVRYYTNALDYKGTLRDEMIAAAWLHDTVEDTGIGFDDLKPWFSGAVTSMVSMLTEDKSITDRSARHENYMKILFASFYEVQIIKMADIEDNFEDIVMSHQNDDPSLQFKNFERFINEKRKVISHMTKVNQTYPMQKLLREFDAFLALKSS